MNHVLHSVLHDPSLADGSEPWTSTAKSAARSAEEEASLGSCTTRHFTAIFTGNSTEPARSDPDLANAHT